MTWGRPEILWLLPVLGGLVGLYLLAVGRPSAPVAVRFPTWPAAEAARGRWIRRHLPAGILAAAIAAIIGSAARPALPWRVPTGRPVVLIIDVSRSMEEADVRPSRIQAAKAAAQEFVRALPRRHQVALVSFGNYATLVVPLTADRDRVLAGIELLSTQLRTQLGTGLIEGVRAVTGEGAPAAPGPGLPPAAGPPVPSGGGWRAAAVLLSDGRASDGVPPLEAAREARARGVRVYTVGVGTRADASRLRSGFWGVLDEPTLRAIAAETGGEYSLATSAGALRQVYRDLAGVVGWERRPVEVSAVAAAVGLLLLLVALGLRARTYPIV